MADIMKQILAKPIQLSDQAKTEKLAGLLRQVSRASSDLYERPTHRIIDDTEQILEQAFSLVLNTSSPSSPPPLPQDNSISDVSWLLCVSAPVGDHGDAGYLGLPPIAANEPILCLIWEHIALLHTGPLEDRSNAATSLVSLARDSDRYTKLIIAEGGIGPLLIAGEQVSAAAYFTCC
ncbi:unnamed protein product [Brassica rapa subsp. narinosa]|uniref:(rape) hypothetical protein n=1 Tax=Brassica napus TaxID=3708 RepID=A0A816YK23_BRANA|nr:unnamed protein product [Brassica napus]